MINSFVLRGWERDGTEELRARKMLVPLLRCLRKEESDGNELALVRYIECVPTLDEVDGASKFVSLQWATPGSSEAGEYVEKGEKDRELVAAGE